MAFRIVVQECDALACGFLCLHACPLGALLAVPRGHSRGVAMKPEGYIIAPRFHGNCNACALCAQTCPRNAISIQG